MSTFSLQLLDFPGNYKKGTTPYGPKAYIALKTYSTIKWCDKSGKKKIDFKLISHECVSVTEFQSEVKRLISELETLSKQAERFFLRDKKKLEIRKKMSSKSSNKI